MWEKDNIQQKENKEKEDWLDICRKNTTIKECKRCLFENLCKMKRFNSQKEYNN